MLKSHEKFHSANGKRLILIADDEQINRDLLQLVLENEYELMYAVDGVDTIEKIQEYHDDLSLILLDLNMPLKSGMDVLKEIKASSEYRHLPVVVLTADQSSEVECLSLGAIDYIPKPYPQASIILARVLRAIELTEDREIIQSTERDPLTGLYNREYFYRYAEQYDQHHKQAEMDAIVVDINHFHMINERFGTAYGDEVLRSIGEKIRETVADMDGIVCRREADTFMVYCPHGLDYKELLENAAIGLSGGESINSRVRLRLGVYAGVDKDMEVERRFDRAKMAADTVRNSFTKTIGVYDSSMHEREIYAEQLIDDFHWAVKEKQFKVYFQPKFDIRPKTPVLASAEALVRWQHPALGMISPGVFIPLFEDNGLIQELDYYVWEETGRQIREWKDRIGFSTPVSVNVSRIDMYDPKLFDKFEEILRENRLEPGDMLLEITESAYTQDSEQIIETVSRLRSVGFRIEMDDFGTGYSSLNMISTLPIDAIKLDMHFVRSAFKEHRDTRMLELIIDISDHLTVPVIAEGVETEEQVLALKSLGCDIVQGYFFSPAVPAEAFENFLSIRKDIPAEDLLPESKEKKTVKLVPDEEPAAAEKPKRSVKLRAVNYIYAILVFVFAVVLALSDALIGRSHREMDAANENYNLAVRAANDLEAGSDYLTVSVRSFVVTGELAYLQDYFEEVNVTCRRDIALSDLGELLEGEESGAYLDLLQGLETSNELMQLEYHAMRLTQLANGYDDTLVPEEVSSFPLDALELSLSPQEMKQAAERLVFGDEYLSYKEQIREYVAQCSGRLIDDLSHEIVKARTRMDSFMIVQGVLLVLLVLAVLGEVIFITREIRIPLSQLVERMRLQESVEPTGAEELRFVTQTYNDFLRETRNTQKKLTHEASHDPLTGLYNRSAYEMFMDNVDKEHIALLIVDVDKFKTINDTHGHDVGDRVLKRVAEILIQSFRSVDFICRFGGDEFVVVMTRATSSIRQLVISKVARANSLLRNPVDGLPKVSLSVGVAFADRENPVGDIFKDADTALYRVKDAGRGGCCIYGYEPELEENTNEQ